MRLEGAVEDGTLPLAALIGRRGTEPGHAPRRVQPGRPSEDRGEGRRGEDFARIGRVVTAWRYPVGSPNFADTLRAIGPPATTDAVIVSDTVWVSRGRPAQSAGLRALQTTSLSLENAATDQHSGTTGGVARNPPSWRRWSASCSTPAPAG